jgi:thiol-disulfide isomerase/thioredoxin
MSSIIVLDARADSLTVTWPASDGVARYRLEFRKASQDEFQLLSDKLTTPQAKKKNLDPDTEYFFRVATIGNDEVMGDTWMIHDAAFRTLSTEHGNMAMPAPTAVGAGSNHALKVSWSKVSDASGYELQMRENAGGADWSTIAPSLSSTEVKKKNLISPFGYQFRVRPSGSGVPFSPPSDPTVARGLSAGIKRWFSSLSDGTLLRSGVDQPVPLDEALGGKEFVLLYASAHWCPPCRQFTPMLANWYRGVRDHVEIVFLSADHDENGFSGYFKTHPWMAVDFDDDARESLMAAIKVSGIPRLVVLSGITGKIIEDNAVGKPFDLNRWRDQSQ